jgi:hypothetical protein
VLLNEICVDNANAITIKREVDREIPHEIRFSRAPLLARDGKHRHFIPPQCLIREPFYRKYLGNQAVESVKVQTTEGSYV